MVTSQRIFEEVEKLIVIIFQDPLYPETWDEVLKTAEKCNGLSKRIHAYSKETKEDFLKFAMLHDMLAGGIVRLRQTLALSCENENAEAESNIRTYIGAIAVRALSDYETAANTP